MNTIKIEEFCRKLDTRPSAVEKRKLERRAAYLERAVDQQLKEITALKKALARKDKIIRSFRVPREIEGFNCRGMGARS